MEGSWQTSCSLHHFPCHFSQSRGLAVVPIDAHEDADMWSYSWSLQDMAAILFLWSLMYIELSLSLIFCCFLFPSGPLGWMELRKLVL